MTIKQIIKAIEQNACSDIFSSSKDTELKTQLLRALKEKYSRPKDTDNKRIARAGKTREAEAYFVLKHGISRPLTSKEILIKPLYETSFFIADVKTENERTPNQIKAIDILLSKTIE